MKEAVKIVSLSESDGWYSLNVVSLENKSSSGFSIEKKWGYKPKEDDVLIVHCIQGTRIIGIDLLEDGDFKNIFYKSDIDLEIEHKEYLEKQKQKKIAHFRFFSML
jgi:hypothetical protein